MSSDSLPPLPPTDELTKTLVMKPKASLSHDLLYSQAPLTMPLCAL